MGVPHTGPWPTTALPIQVFTEALPFGSAKTMLAIMQGRRPSRPTHPTFTDDLWMLMQRCWDHNPQSRPDASEALEVLLTPSVSHSFQ